MTYTPEALFDCVAKIIAHTWVKGRKLQTVETRKKRSRSISGENNSMYGVAPKNQTNALVQESRPSRGKNVYARGRT